MKKVMILIFVAAISFFTTCAHAANHAPQIIGVSQSAVSAVPGASVEFRASYADPDGWQDIRYADLLINTSANGTRCLYARYDQNTNCLFLRNDNNTSWGTGYIPGTANSPANSYAKIDCAKTTVTGAGTTLEVKWAVTFNPAFAGTPAKGIYLFVNDDKNASCGWLRKGAITVNGKPEVVGVNPANAVILPGNPVTMVATYSHQNGWKALQSAQILVNTSASGARSFYGRYAQNENKVYLIDDSGTKWGTGYAPGSAKTLKNSYVEVNCSNVKVSGSGSDLTVNWPVIFKAPFAAPQAKNVYLNANDASGASSGLISKGTLTVDQAPVADFTANPLSGTSPFTVQFTDRSTGTITGYLWDFGDGGTGTEKNPSHTYSIASQWETDYEADDLPQDSGQDWTCNVYGSPLIEATEAGVLHTKVSLTAGDMLGYSRNADFVWYSPYTIETNFKLGEYDSGVSYGTISLSAYDDKYGWRLDFTPGEIYLGIGADYKGSYKMDTTSDYHTYRVRADNGIIQVFVDGVRRIKADMKFTAGHGYRSSVYFGQSTRYQASGSGPGNGVACVEAFWDYLKIDNSSNTPSAKRWYNVSLTATGPTGSSTKTRDYYLTITTATPPEIFTKGFADGVIGDSYEEPLYADYGVSRLMWSIVSGSLPLGLYLDSQSGVIRGTPAEAGSYGFVVKVTSEEGLSNTQYLTIDITPYPIRTDMELLLETELKSVAYFYDNAQANGFVKDSTAAEFISVAATGYGLAALCAIPGGDGIVPANNPWPISYDQARSRVNQILDNCISYQSRQAPGENNYGYGGFLYHFINGDGTRYANSEVSTIDMAIFMAGAVVAGEHFGSEVKDKVETIYNNLDWRLFLDTRVKQFSHGWTPDGGFISNTWDRPGDEAILVSIMALGREPEAQDFLETMYSWPRVEGQYGGYKVTNSYFGSLFTYFSAHCFVDFEKLGPDNPSATSFKNVRPIDWWQNSVNAAYADRQFCIDQSVNYSSYGPDSWGITACQTPQFGYVGTLGAAPCEANSRTPYHAGIIAPHAAISCLPLMRTSPSEALADNPAFMALKHYYTNYYPHLWGEYGPRESFDSDGEFCQAYLGIDVGPTALMIENYRSGLVWNYFMNNERIKAVVAKVFGKASCDPNTIYVDVTNAGDANEDGSHEHAFDKIQEGIDAATSGKTIFVRAGTYNEALVINKPGIVIQGDGRSAIIEWHNSGVPAISFANISGSVARITGFTINNNSGVIIDCASTATAVQIDDNAISGASIILRQGSSAVIMFNSLWSSVIAAYAGSSVRIEGNIMNSSYENTHNGIRIYGAWAVIKNNRIFDSWDGAIRISDNANVVLMNNSIIGTGGWDSTAGITVYDSIATLSNNIISDNQTFNSSSIGAGLTAINSSICLYNNEFNYNRAIRGAAITLMNSNVTAKNNLIHNNTGDFEIVYFSGGGTQDFSYNDIWANTAPSDTTGVTLGTGNIKADPLFNIAGGTYHLLPGSPCINAGDPDAKLNDADGTRNDMGVYGGPTPIPG